MLTVEEILCNVEVLKCLLVTDCITKLVKIFNVYMQVEGDVKNIVPMSNIFGMVHDFCIKTFQFHIQ